MFSTVSKVLLLVHGAATVAFGFLSIFLPWLHSCSIDVYLYKVVSADGTMLALDYKNKVCNTNPFNICYQQTINYYGGATSMAFILISFVTTVNSIALSWIEFSNHTTIFVSMLLTVMFQLVGLLALPLSSSQLTLQWYSGFWIWFCGFFVLTDLLIAVSIIEGF